MSRIFVTVLLSLSALTFASSNVLAQRGGSGRSAGVGAVNEAKDLELCGTSGGGTRIKESNCDVETTTLRTETEVTLAFEIPAIVSTQCAATTTIEYQQRNTAAHVDGTLTIADCAAAEGAFKTAVRVRDESGADKLLEFDEEWRRSDDKDVTFTADYPIGDAELVSVRVRGLTCTCADAPKTE